MKNFMRSVGLSMLLGLGLLLVSCGDDLMKTEKISIDVKEALAPELKDSVTVWASIEYPVKGVEDSVRTAMCEVISDVAFGYDYAGLSLEEASSTWVEDIVAEYRTENLSLLEDMKENASEEDFALTSGVRFLSWEKRVEGYFSGNYADVVSYTVFCYEYTGGAHGSSEEINVNMSLKTGQYVTEAEFFCDGYREPLSTLLTTHLRESLDDQESYDALFVKDIEPNGNFKVSEQGVTYVYGQYEIGPYSVGIIRVSVPWEELDGLVRQTSQDNI